MPIHALILKLCGKALIKHLGKPELLQTCRLVKSAGEGFLGFKAGLTATQSKNLCTRGEALFLLQDSEKLNNRRALLVLGVPSLRPGISGGHVF